MSSKEKQSKFQTVDKNTVKMMFYVFLGLFFVTSFFIIPLFVRLPSTRDALFSIELRYYERGQLEPSFYEEYAGEIIQAMGNIGIKSSSRSMDYATFLDTVVYNRNYDLALLKVEEANSPHLEFFFTENASLNIFNFKDEMDDGYTNARRAEAVQEKNKTKRIELYHEVQNHIMENIVPMIPLFTPIRTYVYWYNLAGFEAELGLSDSLPYMSFEQRQGQENTSNLNIGIGKWSDLNQLTMRTASEKLLISLMMDKLVHLKHQSEVTNHGLIKSWEYVNDTTLRVNIRHNVYWQPNKANTYIDQPFTTKDVLFTLDLMTNSTINNDASLLKWIKSYEEYNETAIDIYIDANPETPENEYYAHALEDLSIYPFPEFYLNHSSGNIRGTEKWNDYAQNPFGTGKYRLDFKNTEIGLTAQFFKFDKWHGHGVLDTEPAELNIERVIVHTFGELYSLKLELQTGKLDLVDLGNDPTAAVFDDEYKNQLKTDSVLENSIIFLAINLDHPVLGSNIVYNNTGVENISRGLAVRKAISHAIDKAYLNNYHDSLYNITDTPLSRYFGEYYHENVIKYEPNITKSMEYLYQAGFDVGDFFNRETIEQNPIAITSVISAITIGTILRKRTKRGRDK